MQPFDLSWYDLLDCPAPIKDACLQERLESLAQIKVLCLKDVTHTFQAALMGEEASVSHFVLNAWWGDLALPNVERLLNTLLAHYETVTLASMTLPAIDWVQWGWRQLSQGQWRYERDAVLEQAQALTLNFDEAGWLQGVKHCPSPNANEFPNGMATSLLVIHNISLPPYSYGGNGVEALFSNQLNPADDPFYASIANLRVSSHFFIRRTGEIIQFVSAKRRAWHAGVSQYQGRASCNDFAIGVELEGCDFEPYTDWQYGHLVRLTQALRQICPIQAVTGHEDIAPQRKTDPGPYFDWARYRAYLPDLA